ncbi:MAG: sigma-70 family RNA polymerase sigma factor [Thermoguttaceae bacterium]
MNSSVANEDDLLAKACRGDGEALGHLLQKYRPYLRIMAQRRLDSRLKIRVDPSDVVQTTFLEAHRDLASFRGKAEGELVAWLRRILDNNLAQTIQRHVFAKKRSIRRERSLDDAVGTSHVLADFLAADQSSPSRRVMRGEAAIRLAQSMDQLPTDQHEAVRLRYLEGRSLREIAEHFDRTEVAVAGLLKRGLRGLRKQLDTNGSRDH